MKKIFLISFIILLNNILFAQNPADSINPKTKKIRKNAVFVELAGHSMLGPNYERKLFTNNHFSIYSSIGISYFSYYDKGPRFPFRISCCFFNTLEFGIGTQSITYNVLPNIYEPRIFYYLNQPFIGYRHKSKRNLLYRVTIAPRLYEITDNWNGGSYYRFGFFPWAGISFGYCF